MRDERGQTASEYAIALSAIVTVALVLALTVFSSGVVALIERAARLFPD